MNHEEINQFLEFLNSNHINELAIYDIDKNLDLNEKVCKSIKCLRI